MRATPPSHRDRCAAGGMLPSNAENAEGHVDHSSTEIFQDEAETGVITGSKPTSVVK